VRRTTENDVVISFCFSVEASEEENNCFVLE
jgi:hypothetical protein